MAFFTMFPKNVLVHGKLNVLKSFALYAKAIKSHLQNKQFTRQENLCRTNMFMGPFKSGKITINPSLIGILKKLQKVFMQNTLMALNKVNITTD